LPSRFAAYHGRANKELAVIPRVLCAFLLFASGLPLRAVGDVASIPIGPNSLAACPGAAIAPSQIFSGQFPAALMGSYVMLPIDVPEGTTQVRVKYCYEGDGNTVDLGIWQARQATAWGVEEFRGWGGSSHPDVAISAQGFSTEEEYLANPKGYVPGRTTRGFLPGAIVGGNWAVELGVGAVAEADADQLADFRVEIELSNDPAFAADPYVPAEYETTAADPNPGWYAGDLHVHAEHSALGDATMTEVFDFAFASLEDGGAGLDFITLSDYVSRSAWDEIGRYQASYPGKLVIRSAEIITYQGHAMNHGSVQYVDHRAGPVYRVAANGDLSLLREFHPPAEMFAAIHDAGGVTQLNHVTTCPSNTEYCRRTCRGCPWDYDEIDTDFAEVDAIEVQSGSFFKYELFTAAAIAFWDLALASGHQIAAVGSSDSHDACVPPCDALNSPIGDATTVVYAASLSEQAILDGIRAGHTYVKLFGNDGPDLRLDVSGDEGGSGIMGDTILASGATLDAEVFGLAPGEPTHYLRLYRDGEATDEVAIDSPGDVHAFRAETPGRYRIQLERPRDSQPDVIVALTSSVTLPEPDFALSLVAAATLGLIRARRH
jgi:hypothetical protein